MEDKEIKESQETKSKSSVSLLPAVGVFETERPESVHLPREYHELDFPFATFCQPLLVEFCRFQGHLDKEQTNGREDGRRGGAEILLCNSHPREHSFAFILRSSIYEFSRGFKSRGDGILMSCQ